MGTSLEILPLEILGGVSDELPSVDQKSVGLVSKKLCNAVTRSLFCHLSLYPTKSSRKTFLQVLSSPSLSKYVRNVHLNTEKEDFEAECNAGESKLPKHFIETFMRAVEFSNLTTITLAFDKYC